MPVVPYVPATTILGSETAKLAGREGEPRPGRRRRRRRRLDARRDADDRADPRARRRRLGGRGDRHRSACRSAAAVGRRDRDAALSRGSSIGVPSVPDLVETLADGRYDLVHLVSPGPAGVAAALTAKIGGIAARRQLPHRARRPTCGCAPATRRSRRAMRFARLGLLRAVPTSSSRRARPPISRCSSSGSSPSGSAAGRAASTSRCSTRRTATPSALPGRGQGALRRAPEPREGRRPARRELPARPRARPAPAPAARRRRARGGDAPRAARRPGHVPRLARRRGAGRGLRELRRLPVLLGDRHLRPGDRRGAGERACPSSPSTRAGRGR